MKKSVPELPENRVRGRCPRSKSAVFTGFVDGIHELLKGGALNAN